VCDKQHMEMRSIERCCTCSLPADMLMVPSPVLYVRSPVLFVAILRGPTQLSTLLGQQT
jgi:hypothetical protein